MNEFRRPEVLLFDVMSTLVYDPFFIEVPAHFQMTFKELISNKNTDAWPAFEKNEISESEFFALFFGDGRIVDGEAMRQCMFDNYRFLDGIEMLLKELMEKNCTMYSLSNYPIWYQMIEAKLHLERFMDWRFVSCRTGVRKPDPQAYLIPSKTLEVSPKQCLFIDDRADNCAAAIAVGMSAIQYRSTEQLREELTQYGVLS